jgi:RNA polymerase sigma-70 factor, ECF subfamily
MKPHTLSHELVERAQQGDQDAFAALFERCRSRLAVIIHCRLSSDLRRDADVDDILQETMMRAFRDIQRFEYRAPGSFVSWASRIAEHVIVDAARSQDRQKRAGEHVRLRSESNPGGPEPAHSYTPSRIFRENESLGQLVETLNLLPEDYRRVILLAKVEGLAISEIAARLEKSNEATSLLLHRAIKRLQSLHEGRVK